MPSDVRPSFPFSYGASNHEEMKNVLRKSMILMGGAGAPADRCRCGDGCSAGTSVRGLRCGTVYADVPCFPAVCCVFPAGWCRYFPVLLFTALNNGLVSAAISFLRTLVFRTSAVLFLPLVPNRDGIRWAVTVAEVCAFVISASFLFGMRKKYRYM